MIPKPHLVVTQVGYTYWDVSDYTSMIFIFRNIYDNSDFYYYDRSISSKTYGWWFTGNPSNNASTTRKISGNNIKVV